MTPPEYLELQTSDMETELKSLDAIAADGTESSLQLWNDQNQALVDLVQEQYNEEMMESQSGNEESTAQLNRPVHSLILCDSTPLDSLEIGTTRTTRLIELLESALQKEDSNMMMHSDHVMPMVHGRTDMVSLMYIQAMQPLSNTQASTCWILSATPSLAAVVLSTDALQVHFVLPMMKIRKGTIAAVDHAINSKSKLSITATTSPGVRLDKIFSYEEWILGTDRSIAAQLDRIKAAFPYQCLEYKLNLDGLDEHSLDKLWEHTLFMDAGGMELHLEVHLDEVDLQSHTKFAILSLLASLASKGQIVSIEIMPTMSSFGGGH